MISIKNGLGNTVSFYEFVTLMLIVEIREYVVN